MLAIQALRKETQQPPTIALQFQLKEHSIEMKRERKKEEEKEKKETRQPPTTVFLLHSQLKVQRALQRPNSRDFSFLDV